MTLPVHDIIPEGLAHATGLRKLRLQPGGPATAQYRYRTRQGYRVCDLYPVASAVPLKRDHKVEYAARKSRADQRAAQQAAWEAELRGLEEEAVAEYRQLRDRAVQTFRRWAADPQVVYLDTETTGLDGVVIEVAAVTLAGDPLFHSRMQPLLPISEGAQAVHGLTAEMLRDAPPAAAVLSEFAAAVKGCRGVAYNAPFDAAALERTWQLATGEARRPQPACAMTTFAPLWGEWSESRGEWKWASLRNACLMMGVEPEAQPHGALGGAQALARLVRAVAERDWPEIQGLDDVPERFRPGPEDMPWAYPD